jgi:integrase
MAPRRRWVREKALWRLLYETAARASEALALHIEDLELNNKRVWVHSKGGDSDWLHVQTGSARLLPRLIGAAPGGPLFLAERRPVQGGDYFGRTVNLAARIAAYASASRVLVSEPVIQGAPPQGVTFVEVGEAQAEGVRPVR